jgi:hypothetical protein
VATIFERLGRERPAPAEDKTKQPEAAAQLLLNWLTQRWRKNTISRRDISNHGPRPIRDRSKAIEAAETLERAGWLTPAQHTDMIDGYGKSFANRWFTRLSPSSRISEKFLQRLFWAGENILSGRIVVAELRQRRFLTPQSVRFCSG